MNWIVSAIALLLAAGGGYAVFLGADINQVEHGWAHLIAGSVLVSASAVMLGLAAVLFKLDRLRVALKSAAPAGAATAAVPGPGLRDTLALPKTRRSGSVVAVPVAAAGATGLAAAAAMASAAGAAVPHESEAVAVTHELEVEESLPPAAPEPEAMAVQPPPEPEMPATVEVASELPAPPDSEPPLAEVPVESAAGTAPEPVIVQAAVAAKDKPLDPLQGDWLDKALAGEADEVHEPAPGPPALEETREPVAQPAETSAPEEDALQNEVAREMSFARDTPVYPAEPVPPAEDAELPPPRDIIGRHQVAGISYLMYADGSIDADDGTQVRHFSSIAELKAHFAPA